MLGPSLLGWLTALSSLLVTELSLALASCSVSQ